MTHTAWRNDATNWFFVKYFDADAWGPHAAMRTACIGLFAGCPLVWNKRLRPVIHGYINRRTARQEDFM